MKYINSSVAFPLPTPVKSLSQIIVAPAKSSRQSNLSVKCVNSPFMEHRSQLLFLTFHFSLFTFQLSPFINIAIQLLRSKPITA